MVWRLASFVVYVFLGLGIGFFVWGSRVANLTGALNRLTLEDETLRTRLARQQDTTGDGDTALLSTLSLLSAEVSMQADLIEKQSAILDKLASTKEQQLEASLTKCNTTEGRLQDQLESCLFAKASLERDITNLQDARSAPRRGSAPFTTSVRSPEEVLNEVNGGR